MQRKNAKTLLVILGSYAMIGCQQQTTPTNSDEATLSPKPIPTELVGFWEYPHPNVKVKPMSFSGTLEIFADGRFRKSEFFRFVDYHFYGTVNAFGNDKLEFNVQTAVEHDRGKESFIETMSDLKKSNGENLPNPKEEDWRKQFSIAKHFDCKWLIDDRQVLHLGRSETVSLVNESVDLGENLKFNLWSFSKPNAK